MNIIIKTMKPLGALKIFFLAFDLFLVIIHTHKYVLHCCKNVSILN